MPLKQYVNLDPNMADQLKGLDKKRAGKFVTFKAKLSKAVEGVPIIFEMTAGADNVSASLEAGNFTLKQLRALSKTAASGMGIPGVVKRRIFTDDKGEAKTTLVLSECGADEFTVKAYLASPKGGKKELASETYVVWRRLYFQASRFKGAPKGAGKKGALPEIPALDWGPVIEEFQARKHNIELVDDSRQDLISRCCNVLYKDEDFTTSAKEGYAPEREPVTIRAVLVNHITSPLEEDMVFPVLKEDEDIKQTTNLPLWCDETMDGIKDFVIDAKWRFVGDPEDKSHPIDPGYIEAVDNYTVKINFKKIPKRHLFDIWRKATVTLKLRVFDGGTNGISWDNSIWMANGYMNRNEDEVRSLKDRQDTTIHEAGHYIGMVPETQVSTYYVGHGHNGGHCSTGLAESQKSKEVTVSYQGLPGTCIMFGESSEGRKSTFCPTCDVSFRSQKIPANIMPAKFETIE